MDGYRIANLIMQAAYLPIHLFFIIKLIKHRQPSPVWRWFILVVTGLWGLIAGRFAETLLYLFWLNDTAYAIAVDFTLASTTIATMSYLFWNLYISGQDRLANAGAFRYTIKSISLIVCGIFITNPIHHLFYEHLELNGLKTHGKLFPFCVLVVYGMLFAGLVISIIHIIRHENEKLKRIIVFSMYPLLPGVINLVRSLTKVDKLDFNPIAMSLSIWCLYEIVFKESYVGVVSESIESVLEQTQSPIVIYKPAAGEVIYENRAAQNVHDSIVAKILPELNNFEISKDELIDDRVIRVVSSASDEEGEFVITFSDITGIVEQQQEIDKQIDKQNHMLSVLEEQKRNIEAYIEALYSIPNLKEKKEMTDSVQTLITEAFERMEKNLMAASADLDNSQVPLEDNIKIAQETITTIRKTVAMLKEAN